MKIHITPQEESYFKDTALATYSKAEYFLTPSDYKRMVNYYNNLHRTCFQLKQSRNRRRLDDEYVRVKEWLNKNKDLKQAS